MDWTESFIGTAPNAARKLRRKPNRLPLKIWEARVGTARATDLAPRPEAQRPGRGRIGLSSTT
jgi:hypothetical protein